MPFICLLTHSAYPIFACLQPFSWQYYHLGQYAQRLFGGYHMQAHMMIKGDLIRIPRITSILLCLRNDMKCKSSLPWCLWTIHFHHTSLHHRMICLRWQKEPSWQDNSTSEWGRHLMRITDVYQSIWKNECIERKKECLTRSSKLLDVTDLRFMLCYVCLTNKRPGKKYELRGSHKCWNVETLKNLWTYLILIYMYIYISPVCVGRNNNRSSHSHLMGEMSHIQTSQPTNCTIMVESAVKTRILQVYQLRSVLTN